jgi:hypothetical protein
MRYPTARRSTAFDPALPIEEGETILGIDTASYQPTDLTALIQKAQAKHVMIRMYQHTIEGALLQAHSRAQVASALANGCTVGTPYYWLYTGVPVARQVAETVLLAQSCGIAIKLHVADVETYTDGSIPTAQEVDAALNACAARGIQGAIYSSAEMWKRIGSPSFPGVPLIAAFYDSVPELDCEPFGGLTLFGKQYSDRFPDGQMQDLDVFDAGMIG